MNLKINLDYKIVKKDLSEEEVEKLPSPQELTLTYLSQAVNQKYEKGLEGSLRRMWGRIQRKFDTAIEANADSIEVETGEIDFLKKAFEIAKFPAFIAKYVQVLEDELDSIKA